MTQKELIKHYATQMTKVIAAHGADSDYTVAAFYKLQAARMGIPQSEMHKWAEAKREQLLKETLAALR